MGAGASSSRRPHPEPSAADIAALDPPVTHVGGEACFHCLPYDEEVKRRSPVVQLEVGPLGFRMLRPDGGDCLHAYPWGQIHSWAHTDNRFSFRFFDDSKKKVVTYMLFLKDLEQLLSHIQSVIDHILAERRSHAIPPEHFSELVQELQASVARGCSPTELLARHNTAEYYFWSEQGRQLLDSVPSFFDKVEVAVLLHSRLIDQNRFGFMLEGLEAETDRENVWHRITLAKKTAPRLATVTSGNKPGRS